MENVLFSKYLHTISKFTEMYFYTRTQREKQKNNLVANDMIKPKI